MFIVLGVTGGIAAYKSVMLARAFVEAGHDVHVIPTEDALRFVGTPTWEAISRNPVTTSVHDDVPEVRHVALGQRADLVVVAPATANTLARMTAGLADDLLGTTLLATRAPVLVAPAMHTEMWEHPSTVHNIAVLRDRGVHVIGPESGRLTGADSGPGRMTEPDGIAQAAFALLGAAPQHTAHTADTEPATTPLPTTDAGETRAILDLDGISMLVSAGGTREPIDPVRFIGNRSSGRQGVAIALAAADRGADVTLFAANIDDSILAAASAHPGIVVVQAGSATELEHEISARADGADVIVMTAAVSDYRVDGTSDQKIRKEDHPDEAPTLHLVQNPDILKGLATDRWPGQTIVGFAAETAGSTEELLERGRRKRARKGVDLLAVNEVGWNAGFEQDENTLHLIDAHDDVLRTVTGTKRQAAEGLLDTILRVRAR